MTITPEEAKAVLDAGGATLVDVRTPGEFAGGCIPGAINVEDDTLEERAAAVLPDKAATILVYCRTGRRSRASAELLQDLGYPDVRDLGGILDWPYEVARPGDPAYGMGS